MALPTLHLLAQLLLLRLIDRLFSLCRHPACREQNCVAGSACNDYIRLQAQVLQVAALLELAQLVTLPQAQA